MSHMKTTRHSTTRSTSRRIALAAAVPLSAALLVAGSGAANATTLPASSGMITMSWYIHNTTGMNLTLTSANNPYGHWQQRPVDLAPGQDEVVSDESNNVHGAQLKLTYAEPDGHTMTMTMTDPGLGEDTVQGSSTDTTVGFDNALQHGWDITATTEIYQGRATFKTSGNIEQYVVPAGIHELQITMSGGAGGTGEDRTTSRDDSGVGGDGTQLSGMLAVTPGEVLDIAVGGAGATGASGGALAGWGATLGAQNFSGGDGANGGGAGGGASIIYTGNTLLAVAGGGGGAGLSQSPNIDDGSNGGNGGCNANGSSSQDVSGGTMGGQTVSQGQSAAAGQDGGAGGGGVLGGNVGGSSLSLKLGGGGGAGTSLAGDNWTTGTGSSSTGDIVITPYV